MKASGVKRQLRERGPGGDCLFCGGGQEKFLVISKVPTAISWVCSICGTVHTYKTDSPGSHKYIWVMSGGNTRINTNILYAISGTREYSLCGKVPCNKLACDLLSIDQCRCKFESGLESAGSVANQPLT